MSYPNQYETNPYAAPQAINPFAEVAPVKPAGPPLGLWRQGNVLVMHKQAPLPDICVKSNLPAQRRLKRTLYWHHPAIFLSVLISVLVYVVLAMCLRKKAVIQLPLTDEWYRRGQKRMAIAWGAFAVSVLMFVSGIMLIDSPNEAVGGWLIFGAFLLSIGAAIGGLIGARLVSPSRMTDEYVWLKGVNPAYLDRLPVWPYQI